MENFKPKRYVIEMLNNHIKHFEQCEKSGTVNYLNKIRNNYITGFITELDAIKSIVSVYDKY